MQYDVILSEPLTRWARDMEGSCEFIP